MAPKAKRSAREPAQGNSNAHRSKRAKSSTSGSTAVVAERREAARDHVRFSDEQDDDQQASLTTGHANLNSNTETLAAPPSTPSATDDDDDDDEVPEAISASDAAKQSRDQAVDAARAAKQQQEADKARRRAKAERIEAEALGRKKRLQEQSQNEMDQHMTGQEIELLPDDVLAEEPPSHRAVSPERDTGKRSKNLYYEKRPEKPTRITFKEDAAPPDTRVGPVNVRVLSKTNRLLAPKADGAGRRTRESWLHGRNHGAGKRHNVNSGFLKV